MTTIATPEQTRARPASPRTAIVDNAIEHHYVLKAEILASLVNGTKVTALCGVRYVVSSDPVTAGTGGMANLCTECNRWYDQLEPGLV